MPIPRILCALLLLAPSVASAQTLTTATAARADAPCSNDADEVRRAALVGFMQYDATQVIPVIEKLLERRDECSVGLRRQALELLARSREPERVELMLRVARTDPSVTVRRQAVQALAQTNSERSTMLLDSIANNTTDSDIAESAMRGLAQQATPEARQALRRVAEKTTLAIEVRERAVNYLGSARRTPEDVQYFKELYGKTSSPQLRQSILRSVGSQRSPETMSWLLGIARDRGQEIELRQVALRSAGNYSNSGYSVGLEIKDLVALYDEFAHQPDMQEQLLDVLAQRPESAATDKLLQIANDGADINLRRRAVQRLAQRRDPRVRQFLLEMVSR
jgi:HEAT repeat protein